MDISWIVLLHSLSCYKVLVSNPCSRYRITIRVQLENLSSKFIKIMLFSHIYIMQGKKIRILVCISSKQRIFWCWTHNLFVDKFTKNVYIFPSKTNCLICFVIAVAIKVAVSIDTYLLRSLYSSSNGPNCFFPNVQ